MTKHVQHEGHNVVSTKQHRMATCREQNPCCCCLNAVIINIWIPPSADKHDSVSGEWIWILNESQSALQAGHAAEHFV